MRAAILTQLGAVPEAGDFPEPEAGQGEEVVEVALAAVNPVDLSISSGLFYAAIPQVPSVVGREGIARLEDGSLAYFGGCIPPYGSMAERTLVESGSLVELPPGVEAAPALACGIAGLAAYLSLTTRARIASGESVLILGAGGVVGQIGVVAARKLGASRVVAAARGAQSLLQAQALGADATVELAGSTESITEAIRQAFGGSGPDVVIDPLWGVPATAAVEAMAFGGRMVQLGQSAGTEATFNSATVRGRCLQILGHTNFAASDAERRDALNTMFSWVASGELDIPSEVLPLDAVGEAWRRQAEGPGLKLTVDPRA